MRSAHYGRGKELSLLVQAYAFICLGIIVTLLLSRNGMPSLAERASSGGGERAGFSWPKLGPLFTGAAVSEEQESISGPEAPSYAPITSTDQMEVLFAPGEAASLTSLVSAGRSSIGTLTVRNAGDAVTNVKVVVTPQGGEFAPKEFALGELDAGEAAEQDVSLAFTDSALSLAGESLSFTVLVGFADSANLLHEEDARFAYPVLGYRLVEDAPKGYARFVPQEDPVLARFVAHHLGGVGAGESLESQRLAARWLFESLRTLNITIESGASAPASGEVRFPAETLSELNASPVDLAVLVAGLLRHAGFDAALVLKGDRLLAAYVDSRGYLIPIVAEAKDYEEALTLGIAAVQNSDYVVVPLSEAWKEYPPAPFKSDTLPLGEWPEVTRQIGRCGTEAAAVGISRAKVPVRLSNTGSAPGLGCVGLISFEFDQRSGEKFQCYPLRPHQVIETELSTLVVGSGVSCEEI